MKLNKQKVLKLIYIILSVYFLISLASILYMVNYPQERNVFRCGVFEKQCEDFEWKHGQSGSIMMGGVLTPPCKDNKGEPGENCYTSTGPIGQVSPVSWPNKIYIIILSPIYLLLEFIN